MEKDFSSQQIAKLDVSTPMDHSDLDGEMTHTDESFEASQSGVNSRGAAWLASQPKLNAKSKSGYILFSAEVRKQIMNENPEAGFGEVSKIVGIEWKKLSYEAKRQYEMRAQFIADERAKAEPSTPSCKPGQVCVYICRWDRCDFHFNSQEGVYEHVRTGHACTIGDGFECNDPKLDKQYVCLWNSCTKYRKDGKPFPTLPRLLRHVKEKHLNTSARAINADQKPKNFFVYYTAEQLQQQTGSVPSTSSSKNDPGRFVHHPYGIQPLNAIAFTVATPIRSPPNSPGHPTQTGSSVNLTGLSNGCGATVGNIQYTSGIPNYSNNSGQNVQYHYGSPSTSTATPQKPTYNSNLNSTSTPTGVYLSNGTATPSINGYAHTNAQPQSANSGTTHYLIHQSSNATSGAQPIHVQYQQPPSQQIYSTSSNISAVMATPTPPSGGTATIQYVAAAPSSALHSSGAHMATQVIYQQPQGTTNTQSAPIQQYVQANINGTMVYIPAGTQYQTYVINPNGSVSAATSAGVTSGSQQPHQIVVHQQPTAASAQASSGGSHVYMQQAASSHSLSTSTLTSSNTNGILPSGASYITSGVNGTSYQITTQHPIVSTASQSTQQIVIPQHSQTTQLHAVIQQQPSSDSMPVQNSSVSVPPNGTLVVNGHSTPTANYSSSVGTSGVSSSTAAPIAQQTIVDPGRTVVAASTTRPAEPVFLAPPNSVQVKRVMHSEAYVKYIESLYNLKQQKTISKWDKNLQSNSYNTVANHKKVPYDWIKNISLSHEDAEPSIPTPAKRKKDCSKEEQEMLHSLWRLRDQLIESTTGIQRRSAPLNI